MRMFLKCFVVAGGAIYIQLLVWAQTECSIFPSFGHQCHGPEGDVWMLPFFFAVVGVPLVIGATIILLWQGLRGLTAIARWLWSSPQKIPELGSKAVTGVLGAFSTLCEVKQSVYEGRDDRSGQDKVREANAERGRL